MSQLYRPPSVAPAVASPRILLISSIFAPEIGGAAAVAGALASNLPENITIVAPQNSGDAQPVPDWAGFDRHFPFPVYRLPEFERRPPAQLPRRLRLLVFFALNFFWVRPIAALQLLRILLKVRPDVLCINTLMPCYWIAAFTRILRPRIRTLFYIHGEELVETPRPISLSAFAMSALRRADAVVAVSSFTRDRAIRCGVPPSKIHVIHNGVDTTRFTPGAPSGALIQRLGIAEKKIILCLGRLDERKGQDNLIAALPAILQAIPNAILLLAGSGPDQHRLRQLTASLSLQPHVIFAGQVDDSQVPDYFRLADLYAMPNRTTSWGDTEGFGLVFLEAGACAKPVVGGRDGGVPDAILDGETGILVDGNSPAQIAAACIRILADPTLAATLGRNGLAHAQRTTWSLQAQEFLSLCRNILPGPTPSTRPTPSS